MDLDEGKTEIKPLRVNGFVLLSEKDAGDIGERAECLVSESMIATEGLLPAVLDAFRGNAIGPAQHRACYALAQYGISRGATKGVVRRISYGYTTTESFLGETERTFCEVAADFYK